MAVPGDPVADQGSGLPAAWPETDEAFLARIAERPDDLGLLSAFGARLLAQRRVGAAQIVAERLVALHPGRGEAHSLLGQCRAARGGLEPARAAFERALALDDRVASAHLGLAELLEAAGEADAAEAHRRRGFALEPVWLHPLSRSQGPSVLVLATAAEGSTPVTPALDPSCWSLRLIAPDHYPTDRPLPAHDLLFNAVSDADRQPGSLARAAALAERSGRPVINPPGPLRDTTRAAMAVRLRAVPDVVTARVERVERSALLRRDAAARLAAGGWRFPLLVRTPGAHTGRSFERVDAPAALAPTVRALPGAELLVLEWLERAHSAPFRKYRWMLVDGVWYPLHLALSQHWKVHYFSADMAASAAHRAAEAAFLADPAGAFGARAMRALSALGSTAPFDLGGIDCDVGDDGRLVVFEMNATMVVAPPPPDAVWDYRRPHHRRVVDAVDAMLRRRLGAARAGG